MFVNLAVYLLEKFKNKRNPRLTTILWSVIIAIRKPVGSYSKGGGGRLCLLGESCYVLLCFLFFVWQVPFTPVPIVLDDACMYSSTSPMQH